MRILGLGFIMVGVAGAAWAGNFTVPEIDTNSGLAALAILSGGLLILRARRKQK